MTERSADAEFRGRFLEPPYFEDLSERGAVKLTSLLRLTGRPHYTLWAQEIGSPHFKERTGQFIPIYYLDLEVTDVPIETRDAVEIEVRIRLGKHRRSDGSVERLISEAWCEVFAPRAGGRRVRLGGTHKQAVFTRPDPDPARRRVIVLHPSLGLGELPNRDIRPYGPDDLKAPPDGFSLCGQLADRDAHVWSYQQTDPNQHIHAMEYVRVMEAFAADELARGGRSARDYHFARGRVLFRRPCFTGEWYRRSAAHHRSPEGEDLLIGAIHHVPGPIEAPTEAVSSPPATWVQLLTKKSLPSSLSWDKGP